MPAAAVKARAEMASFLYFWKPSALVSLPF
jgi:hypothetical protein